MRQLRISVIALTLMGLSVGSAAALDVRYVGAVTEGLASPTGLAVGPDRIAVLEPLSHRVTLYTADGVVSHRVDLSGDAIGLARISAEQYIICDRTHRDVIVVDFTTGRQWPYLVGGEAVSGPVDVVATPQAVHILDAGSNEILIADRGGAATGRISLALPPGEAPLTSATSLAYDASRGVFYVFDQTTSRVLAFAATGAYLGSFCSYGADDGQVTRGGEIAVGPDGFVFITDRFQGRVVVFDRDWEFAANIDPTDFDREPFRVPTGLAIDADGLVYVASTEDRRVHIVHVEVGEAAGRMPPAWPADPVDWDTVAIQGLALNAVVYPGDARGTPVTGIDFQLVGASDTSTVLAEAFDLSSPSLPNAISTLTATWQPEIALADNAVYGWRVRSHAADTVGAWSAFSWFTTAYAIKDYRLGQNYPNPFNAGTTILFDIPRPGRVDVAIYNLVGQKVWETTFDELPVGRHRVGWDAADNRGREVASGVYFYRVTSGAFSDTRKMVLLR